MTQPGEESELMGESPQRRGQGRGLEGGLNRREGGSIGPGTTGRGPASARMGSLALPLQLNEMTHVDDSVRHRLWVWYGIWLGIMESVASKSREVGQGLSIKQKPEPFYSCR